MTDARRPALARLPSIEWSPTSDDLTRVRPASSRRYSTDRNSVQQERRLNSRLVSKWIREAVGLDLAQVERRWKEFPVIIVPKHVSDKHGVEDPYSLFGYLSQVRLAYIAGADLAAIAMCRAVTEILIRFHYNRDNQTDLMTSIKSTAKRPREGSILRDRNIVAKVREANDILHVNKDDIEHRDRSSGLIRDWVQALQDMIVERSRDRA